MVTLTEQIDFPAPYEKLEAWVANFGEEFVKWSPYHIECEMYDGSYRTGSRIRFRKMSNWQLIRDDMILDNRYLREILMEGKYPERIPLGELLEGMGK